MCTNSVVFPLSPILVLSQQAGHAGFVLECWSHPLQAGLLPGLYSTRLEETDPASRDTCISYTYRMQPRVQPRYKAVCTVYCSEYDTYHFYNVKDVVR